MSGESSVQERDAAVLVRRHLAIGWTALLVYLLLGIVLESLHGFKVRWYVDVDNEIRRLMWTLAHAHGVLLGLLNLAFAGTAHLRPGAIARSPFASACLVGATILLPGGFLLGGLVIHQGDPGVGVFLTPAGGLLLLLGVAATLRALLRRD